MKYSYIILIIVLGLFGCTESYLDEFRNDPSNLSGDAFWMDPSNAQKVLTSAYAELQGNKLYSRELHEPLALMTHEADLVWLDAEQWNQENTNAITPRNSHVEDTWYAFYRVIRDANDVIGHSDLIYSAATIPKSEADDILGQAYFIRAFSYHHLASLYSEAYPFEKPDAPAVPLLLEVATTDDQFFAPRASVSEVYAQMEADFKRAIELLPDNNPRKDLSVDAGRISIYAAHGYLGKIYMFQEEYLNAIDQFEIIFNSGHFSLMDTMSYVYDGSHEFNTETILEWNYSNLSAAVAQVYQRGTYNHVTLIHGPKVHPGLFNNFRVSDYSLTRFGDDPRKFESIVMVGDKVVATASGLRLPNRDYPTTRKFYNPNVVENRDPGFTANIVLMRLSDIYLLYAEAQQALGNDGIAAEYMNKVRRRAYFAPVDVPNDNVDYNISGIALRDSIREERWRE